MFDSAGERLTDYILVRNMEENSAFFLIGVLFSEICSVDICSTITTEYEKKYNPFCFFGMKVCRKEDKAFLSLRAVKRKIVQCEFPEVRRQFYWILDVAASAKCCFEGRFSFSVMSHSGCWIVSEYRVLEIDDNHIRDKIQEDFEKIGPNDNDGVTRVYLNLSDQPIGKFCKYGLNRDH